MTTLKKELEVSLSITPTQEPTHTQLHHLPTVADAHNLIATTLKAEGWQGLQVPAHGTSTIQRALAAVHYYSLDTARSTHQGPAGTRIVVLVRWVAADANRPPMGTVEPQSPELPSAKRRHEYEFNDPLRKRLSAYQELDGRLFLVNGHGSGLGAPWGLGVCGSGNGYYASVEELQRALDAYHAQGGWAQWAVQVGRREWEVMSAGVRAWWEAGSHGATELKAALAVDAAHQALDELSLVAELVPTQCVHRALLKLLQVRFFAPQYSSVEVASATEDVRRAVFYAYSDACEGQVRNVVRPVLEQRLAEAKALAIAADAATRNARLAARPEPVEAEVLSA